MFNVLVSSDGTAWETPSMSMFLGRFKEYSGAEAAAVDSNRPETMEPLERCETLLLYESRATGPHTEHVRVGRLRNIRVGRDRLSFQFKETGRIEREAVVANAMALDLDGFEFERTHWAIKDGSLPPAIRQAISMTEQRYDVALTFAGENRDYVEAIAKVLKTHTVEVFYDGFEEADLWGKELTEYFDWVYRTGAQYCVMFISAEYAAKVWAIHERRTALAAAMQKRQEYVLPVRFDDTELPGLRSSIGYIDLKKKTPEQLAELIHRKLGR